jgi:Flp pilus assembly protein TadG
MIANFRSNRILEERRTAGAVLVEAAIALSLFFLFLVSMIDFSIASFRSQLLSHIANRVGREAIIHGPGVKSTYRGGQWGPGTFTTTLSGTDPVAQVAQTVSAGLPRDEVSITLTWPAGNNQVGSPVVVTVEMPWTPSLLRPMSVSVLTLHGISRQYIAH